MAGDNLKILHVIHSADPKRGGPIEGIVQLNKALKTLGHNSEVVSLDDPSLPWVSERSYRLYAVGPALSQYGYTKHLRPWLRAHKDDYDHIVINGLWQYSSYGAWSELSRTRTPYFVYSHGMLDPWFNKTYPLKHLKKRLYWPWGEYRVLRDAAGVCFTCEEERLLARQSFTPYAARECVMEYGTSVPYGDADQQRETFLTAFPDLRSKRILLFLSRIHEKKGCDLLIEAFAHEAGKHHDLHLVMAGPSSPSLLQYLQSLAAARGVAERITWPGMVSGDVKWGAFHAAEAFVLPSHQENFGIAVAEALACGVPVLISDKVNIWREIERDKAGIVAPDTLEGARSLLERWLAMGDAEKQAMSAQARNTFLMRFEISKAAQNLVDTLRNPADRIQSPYVRG